MSAVLFQNMPPLSPEEYAALEASIREHGVQVPILLDENNVVIDGHHRQKIATELGVPCPKRHVFDLSDMEKRTLALTLNLDRRHLSREQRRALVAASVKADPQLSDVQHAKRTGASDKTVASVRREMESRSEIPNVEMRTDSLGRQQPASKPDPLAEPHSEPDRIDYDTGEVLDETPVAPTVTGLDGKTYKRPEPPNQRRAPLPEAISSTVYDVARKVERLERLVADDRLPQNRDKIAVRSHSDLVRIIDALQRVADQINPNQE